MDDGRIPASELVTFRDTGSGFRVKYPRIWRRKLTPPASPVRLVLQTGEGFNGFSVRVDRPQVPTTENLDDMEDIADGIIGTNPTAHVVQQRQVDLNGTPGFYYFYTFTDEQTGAEGAHGHYLLFKERRAYSLVFQAIPAQDFAHLAPVFDQIAETFQTG